MVKPLTVAVRMTCSPKLNIVAAAGESVRLSAAAVMSSDPPPGHGPAWADPAMRLAKRRHATRARDVITACPRDSLHRLEHAGEFAPRETVGGHDDGQPPLARGKQFHGRRCLGLGDNAAIE